jgi:hypothetical protein
VLGIKYGTFFVAKFRFDHSCVIAKFLAKYFAPINVYNIWSINLSWNILNRVRFSSAALRVRCISFMFVQLTCIQDIQLLFLIHYSYYIIRKVPLSVWSRLTLILTAWKTFFCKNENKPGMA